MRKRTRRRIVALTTIVAALVAAVVAAQLLNPAAPAAVVTGGDGPTALAAHLEELAARRSTLKQALPNESGENPGGAADAEFLKRAFPDVTISLAEMEAARSAFVEASTRPPKGKKPGSWTSVGPSEALYPFNELRTSALYVPNAYVAGGRTTSIAIRQKCTAGNCRAWITPAGGGVWRTNDVLATTPKWTYLGGPLGINAAGLVYLDPNDVAEETVYVGTGEANICGSGCVAGVGLYKSSDSGKSWTQLGKDVLGGKGIGSMAVKPGDPNTIYVGTTTALRGMSSVCCSGVTRPVPGAAKWGLYKSTDGGQTWSFIHNGSANAADCTGNSTEFANGGICSPRGVRHVALDPSNPEIVYASSYARGIWRSNDGGTTWTQIKPSLNSSQITTRAAIAVTTLPNGKTRMYVYEGNAGTDTSRLFRSDDVATGTPVFTNMTSSNEASPGWAWHAICDPQCWYDVFVYTPRGHPDIVYAGGDYFYGENTANKRGVIFSDDAGEHGWDMTFDGTDPVHPNGIHPDQHAIVTNPNNPYQFIEAGDGGVVRSSGTLVDRSSWCDSRSFPTTIGGSTSAQKRERCEQMLSRIPSKIDSLNKGLSTLQFISLSVSPHDSSELQGGTQDNGTWENFGQTVQWQNTMIGDGGQSGFDVAKPEFRFHNFFDATTEVNFNNGNLADWIWVADPLFLHPGTQFYAPVIGDPKVSGTLFAGTGLGVFRTKTHGLGTMTLEEAHQHCNTWTGDFTRVCGDWLKIDGNALDGPGYGADRLDGAIAAIERTTADTSTAWAATTTGRVFISKNVDADLAGAVTWTRLDDDAVTPNRFVSSIYVDPANGNRAWVSYSGFNANTPTTPGHVFLVEYNPVTGTSTWTDLSHDMADIPVTDLVRDDVTGDLYAANDFGVLRLAAGTTTWTLSAGGMPNVEVAGLTIVPSARRLYAATHGLSAWALDLAS
jgi:hypothetical protein